MIFLNINTLFVGKCGGINEIIMSTFHRLKKDVGNKILSKFGYACTECGSNRDILVHHKIPMKPDDSRYNDESNLTVLCSSCHMSHHRKDGDIKTIGYGRRGTNDIIYCFVEGCNKPQHARGLCKKHYAQRFRKEQQW